MKQIAYLITDSGEDGRAPESILAAYWTEEERDEALGNDPSKNYRSVRDMIVDPEQAKKATIEGLNGLECLLLKLPNWYERKAAREGRKQ